MKKIIILFVFFGMQYDFDCANHEDIKILLLIMS
jgi:hypothetical protein